MRIWIDPDRLANHEDRPDRGHPGDPAGEPGRRRQDRRSAGPDRPDHEHLPSRSRDAWRRPRNSRRSSSAAPMTAVRSVSPQGRRSASVSPSENSRRRASSTRQAGRRHPDLPVRRRQRGWTSSTASGRRWTASRGVSPTGSTTRSSTTPRNTMHENISEVGHTLLEGVLALVMIVVFVFLQGFRATLSSHCCPSRSRWSPPSR